MNVWQDSPYWKQSRNNIYVAAHRGFCAKYPENTIPAFEAALALGVDQIETDVRITKDGELVLIHDVTVDRTSDGKGKVDEFTYEELTRLDFGLYKGEEFRGTRVVTLKEFFELVKDHPTLTLDLELKEYPHPGREEIAFSACDRVIAMVEEYGFADRIVLNSANGKLHEYVQDKYGSRYRQHVFFPVMWLPGYTRSPYTYAYCCCMFSAMANGGLALPAECDHMAALGVQPWGGAYIRDEKTLAEAIACGVTLITCNNPDVILTLLRKWGKHE